MGNRLRTEDVSEQTVSGTEECRKSPWEKHGLALPGYDCLGALPFFRRYLSFSTTFTMRFALLLSDIFLHHMSSTIFSSYKWNNLAFS